MHVRIYHNVARDHDGHMIHFLGYEQGHPLVPVFDADIDLSHPDWANLPEAIFEACNVDVDQIDGPMRSLARAYRERRLRSLSVGDVVVIGDGDDRIALKVAQMGFSPVPTAELNVVNETDHGTEPWPVGAPRVRI